MNAAISPELTIDSALKKASLLVFLLASPAYFIGVYRNLFIDFLPVHVAVLSIIWIGFYFLSSRIITSSTFRFYSLLIAFLILFFVTGFRNQSIIIADFWLVIICGLLALRQSLWIVFLVAIASTAGLYLIVDEQFIFPGLSVTLHVMIHSFALLIGFVLFSAIRNIVLNFQVLYETQVGANTNLIEKNKRSYLLAQEAEEDKEEEKHRLMTAAYSLYSQISTLQNIIKFAEENNDQKSLQDSRKRMEDIQGDLLEFSKSGKYINSQTSKLTISDLAYVLDNHLKPYAKVCFDDFNCSVTFEDKSLDEFEIPINYIKLLAHHLIQHCRENHQASELKFDIQKGIKARNMQQIKLNIFVYSNVDLSETDFSKLNREMESKSYLNSINNHASFIKILLRSMSGSLKASSMGNAARYDMSFWVD